MRVLVAFVLCAICALSINAATTHVPADQPTIEWVATYGGNWTEQAFKIIESKDSSFVFVGMSLSYTQGQGDLYIVGINRNGDTIWSQLYGGMSGRILPRDIISTHDGGLLICGSNSTLGLDSTFYVLKTTGDGFETWHTFLGIGGSAKAVAQGSDSSFVLAGYFGEVLGRPQPVVIKITHTGDSVWTQLFTDAEADIYFEDLIRVYDNNFVVCGRWQDTTTSKDEVFVAKLSETGSILWSHHFGAGESQSGRSLSEILDSTLIIVGMQDLRPLLWHLDTAGILIDSIQFGDSTEFAVDVAATVDGGFVICSTIEGDPAPNRTSTARIRKFDSLLNEEWMLELDSSYDELGSWSIQQTSEGGYIFGGRAMNHISEPDMDYYGLKLATQIPYLSSFSIDGTNPNLHVVSDSPLFVWSVIDPQGIGQTAYEIEVTDNMDWAIPPGWITGIVVSSDTAVIYGGSPLVDGITYFLRIRVSNGQDWSPWYETTFRMNSVPTIPIPMHPRDDEITGTSPTLWIQNSTDAESDTLTYDFFVCVDTAYGEPDPIMVYDMAEGTDSTGWQLTEPLDENKRYWWMTRAYDGHEYSDWSHIFDATFFVNATPELPQPFKALYPPDTGGLPVFDMLPEFWWERSYDPDPLDTVRYMLEIAIDSQFNFVYDVDSIFAETYTLTDSLQFATRYWWRVTATDNTGMSTVSWNTPDFWTWALGDVDYSHDCNVADLSFLVSYLFLDGPAPYPLFTADVDGDCEVNVADLSYLVSYLFLEGPAPEVGCE